MEHDVLICECNSVEHMIVFSYIEDEVDGDVYVEYHLKPLGFWGRLVHGIKYIFGHRSKWGDFDNMILKRGDVDKLERVVEYMKKANGRD